MNRTRILIPAAAVLLVPACSSDEHGRRAGSTELDSGSASASKPGGDGAGSRTGDDALVAPEGLTVSALPGGNGVLDVIALTLREGQSGLELYAALKNGGDIPACDAAFSVELFDESQVSVAAGIGALFTRHFYRLSDGSGTIAACVSPGDVTMAAVTDWPSDVAAEEVGYVVYRCPYFALDVVPIGALSIARVTSLARDAGTAYTGTLVNELDVTVKNPSVTVFPTTRVGRPLGVATGRGTKEIPPGGSWAFETSLVDAAAPDYAAYPAGGFAN